MMRRRNTKPIAVRMSAIPSAVVMRSRWPAGACLCPATRMTVSAVAGTLP